MTDIEVRIDWAAEVINIVGGDTGYDPGNPYGISFSALHGAGLATWIGRLSEERWFHADAARRVTEALLRVSDAIYGTFYDPELTDALRRNAAKLHKTVA